MTGRLQDFRAIDTREASLLAVLMSVCAYFFANLPQILMQPSWLNVLFTLLGSWRLYLACNRIDPPTTTIVSSLAILGVLGVYFSQPHADNSVKATMALSVLVACRNLQSKTVSQFSSSLMLLPLIPMGYFLDENPDWYVLYCIALFWLIVFSVVALWDTRSNGSVALKRTWKALAIALPLVIVCFYLVPRPGGIWKQNRAPTTGMSNSLKPGSIGKLAKSDGLAFTATLSRPVLSPDMYWRGAVLRSYDGYEWRETNASLPSWQVQPSGKQISYNIVIPDSANGFRYVLEHADSVEALKGSLDRFRLSGSGVLTSTAQDFVMYKAWSNPKNVLVTPPTELDRRIPTKVHPRTNALVASFVATSSTPAEFLERTRQWIFAKKFVYSMEPGEMDGDWMDTFMFERRKGFCEHYASTVTYMLRRAGYAARVVAGYQGGDYQPKSNMYTIPQAAAHAWAEYWDPQTNRWVRIDPTTWVSPERLAPQGWKESERELLAHGKDASVIGQLKYITVQLSSKWNRWVANFDAQEQQSMFSKVGEGTFKFIARALALAAVVILFWLLRADQVFYRSPDIALHRLRQKLVRLGVDVKPGDTALSLVTLASSRYPEHAQRLEVWYLEYEGQAYANKPGAHMGFLTTTILVKLPSSIFMKLKRVGNRLRQKA